MKLIALDTTTDACSVALRLGETDDFRHIVEPRAHTARLLPMIRDLLRAHDCDVAELHAVVLGNGPGSFIGMRIGASVAQGLAYGAGLPVVAVSSLAAIAAEAFAATDHDRVAVAQDARMSEIYLGRFRRDDENLPAACGDVVLHSVARRIEADEPFALAGAAWRRYPQLRDALPAGTPVLEELEYPNASRLLDLGAREYAAGRGLPPERLEPEYVRERVAAVPGT